MANRFLNSISINDEYTLPENDGSAGQAIITDGSGNLSFGSTVASSADSSESIHITVKNTSGATITKGTPVYITGETGNSGKIEVAPADASDSAKMPAVGILESTLSDNAEGFCVQGGLLEGLVTDTIDGTTTTANDTVYVKSGGGLTMTKPTGSDNLIQNIAKIARTHASNGSLIVSSILRTNDVPNLPEGRIWVGDGNTLVSDTVYVDEPNNRVGIGTTSPATKLDVQGASLSTYSNISWEGVNAETYGTLNAKYSASSAVGRGASLAFIGDSGKYSTRIPFTSAVIKSEHESAGNNEKNTSLVFYNHSGGAGGTGSLTERMRINSSGNVGIGTDDPGAKLEVFGTGNSFRLDSAANGSKEILFRNVGTGTATIKTDGDLKLFVEDAGKNILFDTNGGEKMRITSGGELIINGTTSAYGVSQGYPLHVKGTSSQGYVSICRGTQSSGSEGLIVGTDSSNAYLLSRDNINLVLGTNNLSHVFIKPNGNVGIGTTDPSSQLSIGSNAITTKKPTVVIADGVAGGSLVIRGLSPILSFDRTGADPQNKILMDNAGLEFKTGTLDAEGDVDFKITGGGDLQLSKGAKISNQENIDIDSAAAEVVAQVAISYTAAFFDFVVKKGTNIRSGTVYACHDGTNVEFTETSTNDLGDTSDVTLSVDKTSTNLRLIATVTSDDWSVKSLIRAI